MNLSNPIIIRSAIACSAFTVLRIEEVGQDKVVKALVQLSASPLVQRWFTVWSGASYDAAGQWTDTSLNNAIKAQIEDPAFLA